jgi:hypothetical protein
MNKNLFCLFRIILFICVGFIIIIAIFKMSSIFYNFQSSLPNDKAALGQFGDFFGGILNPTISLFTLIGLLITIIIQRETLKASQVAIEISSQEVISQNKKIEQQMFETTFFNLVTFSHNIVTTIDLPNIKDVAIGRDSFRFLFKVELERIANEILKLKVIDAKNENFEISDNEIISFNNKHKEHFNFKFPEVNVLARLCSQSNYAEFNKEFNGLSIDRKTYFAELVYNSLTDEIKLKSNKQLYNSLLLPEKIRFYKDIYSEVVNNFGSFFEHYFKNIECILQFVDNSKAEIDKQDYIRILLSQLSNYEIIGLYYYCLGSALSDKLIVLINKYDVFKDIRKEDLFEPNDYEELW